MNIRQNVDYQKMKRQRDEARARIAEQDRHIERLEEQITALQMGDTEWRKEYGASLKAANEHIAKQDKRIAELEAELDDAKRGEVFWRGCWQIASASDLSAVDDFNVMRRRIAELEAQVTMLQEEDTEWYNQHVASLDAANDHIARLDDVARKIVLYAEDGNLCPFCKAGYRGDVPHLDDCLVTEAREARAALEAPDDRD